MRILCLHGQGTSGAIFRSQTAAFRQKLPADWHFDFVDAPFEAPSAPGIEALFGKSKKYSFWPVRVPGGPPQAAEGIRQAHAWLSAYLAAHAADEPFDAVCCFSQGAALAVSYLLYLARGELQLPEELQRHGGPDGQQPKPPFRKAIFICGGVPLAALDDLGLPVSARAWHINDVTSALLRKKAGALMTMAADPDQYIKGQPRQGLWDDVSDLLHDPKVLPERDDVFGLDYTQFPKDAKVTIPTLHIYGAKDPRWPAAVQLSYFCENPITYDHGGGHEIPRSTEVSNKIAELITTLLTKD